MTSARRVWLVELICVIGLLLLAAALRLYRLQDYPAGYHNDEVTDAHIIETVVAGRRAVFFPEDTGSEPFYMYWSALFSAALGHTVFALRLPSAFLGMMALCAGWVLTRRLLGPLPAGVALGALGVSWWGVLLNRITLHVAPVAPMLALAVYFFWRGMCRVSRVESGEKKVAVSSLHSRLSTYTHQHATGARREFQGKFLGRAACRIHRETFRWNPAGNRPRPPGPLFPPRLAIE